MTKTIRVNLFMRNKRFRKKLHLNMMGLRVLFDVTTTIYSLILVAYLVAAFFITSDIINESHDFFMMMENRAHEYFWFILAVLPFRYVMQSFQWPGVIFSTSEHKLSMLPFARTRVWLFACVLKWLKNLVLYVIIGGIISVVTPISPSLIIAYMTVLFGYDMLFTVPLWKLYQERGSIKWAALVGVLFISTCTYLLEAPFIALIIPLILFVLHILLIPQLFNHINWGRVTEISDFKIWNMPLISQVTKSSFKRSKRYSIFRQSKRRKKPFKYTHQSVHHRLWIIYFGKNLSLILRLVGTLLLLLTILAFVSDLYFHIGIAISMYIYLNVGGTFFRDRFQSDILRALPWDLLVYKRTFFKWTIYGASILFIPVMIYGIIHWSMWEPLNWLFYGCVFFYLYQVKIDKSITLISKRLLSLDMSEFMGIVFLVMIIASSYYPALSLGLIICVIFSRLHKKHFHTLLYMKDKSVT